MNVCLTNKSKFEIHIKRKENHEKNIYISRACGDARAFGDPRSCRLLGA
jgi:hypothetical protein